MYVYIHVRIYIYIFFHLSPPCKHVHSRPSQSSFPFLISAFEDYLKAGRTMRISLDDDDLYAAYILNKTHTLTKESKDVLALTD